MKSLLRLANLSLLILFPIAWFAPLLRAGLLPLFGLSEITVISGLQSLWESDVFLALLVTAMALFAPYLKTIGLALVQFRLLDRRVLPVLHWLGKLAMADIFLVALYIVVVKGIGYGRVEVAWGSTCFPAASWPRSRSQASANASSPRPTRARQNPDRHPCRRAPGAPQRGMGKSPSYTCSACGAQHSKWSGRCDVCGAWNTIAETVPLSAGPAKKSLGGKRGARIALSDLATVEAPPPRTRSGIAEFDRVLGGGLVAASAILVGGDPGIGKSTLLLQAAASFARAGLRALYVSGEEASAQIQMRARRLMLADAPVKLATETNLRDVLTTLESEKPDIAIIDSVQTMWADNVESAPGSVSQVRAAAHELTTFAKRHGICVVLVGHVTKDGQIAGPRVIEHMVDTVLYFEGERGHQFRILRAVKNRFGPADEIGVFEMGGTGLAEVPNPSALFLSEREAAAPGSVVFAGVEGTRPVLCELQALVAPSPHSQARRTSVGWDGGRLAMILAVLEARCGVPFAGLDVYLNVAGGLKIAEPAADLAVACALLSAREDVTLPADTVVFGEISLSGALRPVGQTENRLKEARKLGFSKAIAPTGSKTGSQTGRRTGLEVRQIPDLGTIARDIFGAAEA